MQEFLHIIHVLVALAMIGLVLLQQGKGADAGAAFGAGASATVFGSQGSGSFLTRATSILAAVFFMTSLSLAYFSSQKSEPTSVIEAQELPQTVTDGNIDVPLVPSDAPTGSDDALPVVPE